MSEHGFSMHARRAASQFVGDRTRSPDEPDPDGGLTTDGAPARRHRRPT